MVQRRQVTWLVELERIRHHVMRTPDAMSAALKRQLGVGVGPLACVVVETLQA